MSVSIRQLSTTSAQFDSELTEVLHWSSQTDGEIEQRVSEIIQSVRHRGDAAVLELTQRLDGLQAEHVQDLRIGPELMREAFESLAPDQQHALRTAAHRITHYHQHQAQMSTRSWSYRDAHGSLLGQKVTPLDRVGIYVPGGKAAYPSSVLMNAIPAQVAGVGEIVMAVPTPAGERNRLVLAAAHLSGVHAIYTMGGAQAVAALAYGTQSIPRVDKITGPGNAYVASAKRRVFGQVGIDMIAGPSEILVIADGSAPPHWVAMDLFSQAEHDELAQSLLLCPDAGYIERVRQEIERWLPQMPRADIIRASLQGRGALILTRSMQEACALSNRIAPEHLEVSSTRPDQWEPLLRHAGAIFLGAYTSESLGDYCAGPNHVLPTSGTARFSSPLGVYDFVKRSSLIEVSQAGAGYLGPLAGTLADGEGLFAHALAARLRLEPHTHSSAHEAQAPDAAWSGPIRADVRAMSAYVVQPGNGMIKLDAMENPFTLPAALQAELGRRLATVALNRYPGERIQALADRLQQFAQVPPGCSVMLGNGSDELIDLLCAACQAPGATVLAPVPGFVMYAQSTQLRGMEFVGVALTADFELDESAMRNAIRIHRPALTFLAYPNNPTANLWDDDALDRLVVEVGQQGGLVVFDEAYQPFSPRTRMAQLGRHPHVLVLRTLSKFGLAGVRLGYLCGPQAVMAQINKVRPPYNVSALNAEAAWFALDHASEYEIQAQRIAQQRQWLEQQLAQLPGVRVFPSQANMLLVRVQDSQRTFDALKARKILVKHIAPAHPLLAQCLRLTVGSAEENQALITALKEIL